MNAPYYQDEHVTLYHGDGLTEHREWLEADVLVTDPPYGVKYSDRQGATIANDHDFTAAASAIAAWGSRPVAAFANHASLHDTLGAVRQQHERVRVMTWHKTNVNGGAPGNPWLADVEFVVCGLPEWPGRPVSALISARRFTGNPAWNASPDAYLHPTQKPITVMASVIAAMPPGVIADPFAGSGSTLMAARNAGRRSIGVEIEEKYCEVIAKRLDQGVLDFGEVTA